MITIRMIIIRQNTKARMPRLIALRWLELHCLHSSWSAAVIPGGDAIGASIVLAFLEGEDALGLEGSCSIDALSISIVQVSLESDLSALGLERFCSIVQVFLEILNL